MSHHFQILSLCERKNLRDLCRESNPGSLNYMSRAHYLYHWIRDLHLASSFLNQPKMRDLGVHFPKIFRGRAPGPPFFSQPLAASPQPPHLKTSSYASAVQYCTVQYSTVGYTVSEHSLLYVSCVAISAIHLNACIITFPWGMPASYIFSTQLQQFIAQPGFL